MKAGQRTVHADIFARGVRRLTRESRLSGAMFETVIRIKLGLSTQVGGHQPLVAGETTEVALSVRIDSFRERRKRTNISSAGKPRIRRSIFGRL